MNCLICYFDYYGVCNRKKRAGSETLIGIAFENAPPPLNTPVVLVVHAAEGVVILVVVNQV